MARHKRQDDDLPSIAPHSFQLGKLVDLVISTFHVDLGSKRGDHRDRSRLIEANHGIDCAKRSNHFGAFFKGVDGASGPFAELSHRLVGVESYHQHVTKAPCLLQISHVPNVKDVENTVRKNQLAPTALSDCLFERDQLHETTVARVCKTCSGL